MLKDILGGTIANDVYAVLEDLCPVIVNIFITIATC